MMKKILAALFLGALMTCAHAQGLVAPGHVIGNGTSTNPHAATDSSLSSVMDQALCGNNNSVAIRSGGLWTCLNIGTGVVTAIGNATNATGGFITWPLDLTGSGVANQLPLSKLAAIAADNLLGNFTGSSAAPQAGALVNCATALTYSTTTHSFSCNGGTGTGTVTEQKNTASTGITASGNCDNTSTNASSPCNVALSLTNQTLEGSPTNPTGTNSATAVMMGMGSTCHLTPSYSGRMRVTFDGSYVGTGTNNINFNVRYGTGTAPANAAAASGTIVGPTVSYAVTSAEVTSFGQPFSLTRIITGLTPGTAYWLDMSISTNGTATTATISSVNCAAQEF